MKGWGLIQVDQATTPRFISLSCVWHWPKARFNTGTAFIGTASPHMKISNAA